MTLFMLMNLGFAGTGAAAPINTVVPTGSGSFVAIYRARHAWILFIPLLERLIRLGR